MEFEGVWMRRSLEKWEILKKDTALAILSNKLVLPLEPRKVIKLDSA